PEKRYQTADALAEDLRRFLSDRPILARRTSARERVWRWCRRNPVIASLATAIALLLVVVAVVSMVAAIRLEKSLERAEQAERQARLREAEALVGQAYGIRLSHRPGQRLDALEALRKATAIGRELGLPTAWFDKLRNEACAALALPDVHITKEWDVYPPDTSSVDLSEDFEWYARTNDEGACTVRRLADDSVVADIPAFGKPAVARFGPGRLLAITSRGRIRIWDLRARDSEPILKVEKSGLHNFEFDPTGRFVGILHNQGVDVHD